MLDVATMPTTQTSSTADVPLSVEVVGATKRYGSLRAADAVSLQVRKGEFFTLLGSSGSGKTTTLRLIGGFEPADEGAIYIGGVDVTALPAHKRDAHTVFQDYALFPHLSVFENVAFAPRLKGVRKSELRQRVMEAIALVQLAGMENRKPDQLSGGQQQRVALARAVVDRPAVLLLDEPLSALDAKIRAEVREELKMLQRRTGITFVYVTHDQEEALTLSDRIAVMRGGKVLQVGTPLDVYERPADLFVAQFIGKANFIRGTLRSPAGPSDRATLDCQGRQFEGTISPSARTTSPLEAGTAVRVMIRPENLRLTPRTDNDAGPGGTVMQSHYLGFATEYLVESDFGILRALEIRHRGATPLAEGTKVSIQWRSDEALVYRDEDDGSRAK